MNKTQLRERVVRRLYGDAWRDNWKTIPEALEIAVYKDEWKKYSKPLVFKEIAGKHDLLRQWHQWFVRNNISRLDYDIHTQEQEQFTGLYMSDAVIFIHDEDVKALFKLTFFRG
tara:strand:+ start:227 stop:568 length:342 start_codon:yes stop_codon:yes gene_type:complete